MSTQIHLFQFNAAVQVDSASTSGFYKLSVYETISYEHSDAPLVLNTVTYLEIELSAKHKSLRAIESTLLSTNSPGHFIFSLRFSCGKSIGDVLQSLTIEVCRRDVQFSEAQSIPSRTNPCR